MTARRGGQAYIVHEVTFAVTTADVTLTAAQARGRRLTTTGTLTGNRNVIVPNSGEWIVFNNCGGAFTLDSEDGGRHWHRCRRSEACDSLRQRHKRRAGHSGRVDAFT